MKRVRESKSNPTERVWTKQGEKEKTLQEPGAAAAPELLAGQGALIPGAKSAACRAAQPSMETETGQNRYEDSWRETSPFRSW